MAAGNSYRCKGSAPKDKRVASHMVRDCKNEE